MEETTKHILEIEPELEIEYTVGCDDIVFRNNDSEPPMEISFPLDAWRELADWIVRKCTNAGAAPKEKV